MNRQMQEADDIKLLREYANGGSDDAFRALVSRYINLVYSAALRHTGNADNAQEITQAVFIILARKAARLPRTVVLSGWLYQTARLVAANFRRTEFRRVRREQEAQMQSISNEPPHDTWTLVAPMLDAAMGELGDKDRNAIVLRFFEEKSLHEVGVALGSNEDAARMRIQRALEKLRTFFARRGVSLSAAAIGAAVSASSVQATPAGMAAAVSAIAAKGTTAAASVSAMVEGTLRAMALSKLKFQLSVGAGVAATAGLIVVILPLINAHSEQPPATIAETPAAARLETERANREPLTQSAVSLPDPANPDLSPTNLIARIAQAYAALTSYRDSGSVVHRYGDDEWIDTFSMHLARTNYYRIDMVTAAHPYSHTYHYWSDGDGDFSESTVIPLAKAARREFNLSAFSSGNSTVPSVFFNDPWGNQLKGLQITWSSNLCLARLPDEPIGGVDCYVLWNSNAIMSLTMWVGKDDFLIRRCRQFSTREQLTASASMAAENMKRTGYAPPVKLQEEKFDLMYIETHENIFVNEPFAKEDFIPARLEPSGPVP